MKIIVKDGLFGHKEIIHGDVAEIMVFITKTLKDMYKKGCIDIDDFDYIKILALSSQDELNKIGAELCDLVASNKDPKTVASEMDNIIRGKKKQAKKVTSKKTASKKTTKKGAK